ncbi:response regulator [Rhizobium phaseoli]|uniref:response regulator n=1 Tax=Rhizobium phaseoli TaxID=396 RepID=UPI000311B706|nr:response regulator [Rhizobium phaseoli]KKZ83569.1 response regulator receiver domain-containing protein [Rhizobium phaseoli Ch24-10]RDJ03349.1 response regulator [Rhizobium phaseoli]RDJ05295.1 response regulator [Rhizobium phaseoli]
MIDPVDESTEGRIDVLVVEDEFFIADELRRTLINAGFRVQGPVATIEDALDLIERERPSVAVLDVHIGKNRVTPVALELKKLAIPFVLTAASTGHELARYPVLAEATNLGKPTDAARLVAVIPKLVG